MSEGILKLRKSQVLGVVLIFVGIVLLFVYMMIIPIQHYYSWTNTSPPVEIESIINVIMTFAGLLIIPIVLGTIIFCLALCWIGWVLIRTPDGMPDWNGILESDEEQ